jgi:hypothetical protein
MGIDGLLFAFAQILLAFQFHLSEELRKGLTLSDHYQRESDVRD